MIFKILLIIHLFADFNLQNKDSVQRKETEVLTFSNLIKSEHIKHSLIHAFIFFALLCFINYQNIHMKVILLLTFGYFISHFVIDFIKTLLAKKLSNQKINLFYGDQILHLIVLFLISFLISNYLSINSILFENELIINWLLAILLINKTANVIFQVTFEKFSPKSENERLDPLFHHDELDNYDCRNKTVHDIGFENAGALIGILERLLIIIMLAIGDVTAIAFALGIKSIVRFEKLKEPKFGEYFLIGTLFSVIYTLVVYILIFKFRFS